MPTLGDVDPAGRSAYERYRRALEHSGAPPDSLALEAAEYLTNLGLVADRAAEYAVAADAYERALEIRSRILETGDIRVLKSRYNVAELARVTGAEEFASCELEEVVRTLRDKGDEAPEDFLALTLKNLGWVLLSVGRLADAESTFRDGLKLGGQSPAARAELLSGLGHARRAQGGMADIEEELAAMATAEVSAQGEGALTHLGILKSCGDFASGDDAEDLYRYVIDRLAEREEPEARWLRGSTLASLGLVRWARGDADGAMSVFSESASPFEEFLAARWRVRSAFDSQPREPWPLPAAVLTLAAGTLNDRKDARALAFRLAVGRKRVQAEALAAQNELILEGRTDLIEIRDLAAKVRRSAAWSEGTGHGEGAAELVDLEETLSRQVPREALLKIATTAAPESVAAALPGHATLIEYVKCSGLPDVHAIPKDLGPESAWYAAFVLPGARPDALSVIDLGAAEPIDTACHTLRAAIAEGSFSVVGWRAASRALAQLVWDPIVGALPSSSAIEQIAPDGALCSVPFDALIDSDGEPLLRTRTLATVSTGRDVHRFSTRANWRPTSPVVISAPDFGEPWDPFEPLPSTAEEGQAIAGLLDVQVATANQATRDFLLTRSDPEILHLATHGYYSPSGARYEGLAARLAKVAAENPLMRSGVALADANCVESPGIVTALDVLGMSLAGTDLVVLSACQSGLGDLDEEEGLLGLARSFLLAGARSVVWSLWRIDDEYTATQMERFYRRVLGGFERADALRDTKRELYAERPEQPDVWAGFVLQGDPSALLRHSFVAVPSAQIYDKLRHEAFEGEGAIWLMDDRLISSWDLSSASSEEPNIMSINVRNVSVGDAMLELDRGQEALERQDLDEAENHFRRSLELLEGTEPGQLLPARLHGRLAAVAGLRGDFKISRREGYIALRALDGIGADSFVTAIVLDNLGISEFNLGKRDSALAHLKRALRMKQILLPPGDPQVSFTEQVIAQIE